ncbi:ribosome recycling factor [Candidatus Kinetoplastibacterium oncopeltii TCC290E]|uniref:Ribosome-recycling factor n=1 Tax=Candidatus Kinetoplastidibacterium stringomonadis TCC290E TaxID=1208920 RepID=M1LS14_9PROT|nr:ribosome recycling factor [Candidatus Kinetoplastibacterium oncopeltii]AGF48322.1 ribosome recycling factor [Candidatus Kinetoplastibacterium oncopeltii TCC290E]
MNIDEIRLSIESKMSKSVDVLVSNLAKIRTGRAHVGILDHISVDYYGSSTSINKIANVNLLDARNIQVVPYEKKMINVIDKAIRESDLGLNPISFGDSIKVPMPPLTEERRKNLVKVVKSEGEETKVAVRNIRREANDLLKKMVKDKDISEDDEKRSQESIQKITDHNIVLIGQIISKKETEIMAI